MTVLVTGGLGYIGSHIVRLLTERAVDVIVIDDFSTGIPSRVASAVKTRRLDLASPSAAGVLANLMREHEVRSVIHLAARKQVEESVARPVWYYSQNITSLANVLTAMVDAGVARLVFSSSAAVYGTVGDDAVDESHTAAPLSPYGETKLVGEWLVANAARAHGLRALSLRYFNVGGAGWPDLGDTGVSNLIPLVFQSITAGCAPIIFGDDYPTPDGTCVRDYVHVLDVAEAHLAALAHLDATDVTHDVFNVGTGRGTSVREVIDQATGVTGSQLLPRVEARRSGDPACVVANTMLIEQRLSWKARFGIREIVASAWSARQHQVGRSHF